MRNRQISRNARYNYHTSKAQLNDNALTSWFNKQTKNVTGGVQNALDSIKTPTVTVSLDAKAQKTILGAAGLLALGMALNGYFKRN